MEPIAVTRINGKDMINYVQNKKIVNLIGKAGEPSADGRSFKLTTLDNLQIIVKMATMMTEEISGYVEIEGKVLGKSCFDCRSYGVIRDLINEPDKEMDPALFAQVIECVNKNPSFYITVAARDDLPQG